MPQFFFNVSDINSDSHFALAATQNGIRSVQCLTMACFSRVSSEIRSFCHKSPSPHWLAVSHWAICAQSASASACCSDAKFGADITCFSNLAHAGVAGSFLLEQFECFAQNTCPAFNLNERRIFTPTLSHIIFAFYDLWSENYMTL